MSWSETVVNWFKLMLDLILKFLILMVEVTKTFLYMVAGIIRRILEWIRGGG